MKSKTSCCVTTLSRWLQSEYPKPSKLYHPHQHIKLWWSVFHKCQHHFASIITPRSYHYPYQPVQNNATKIFGIDEPHPIIIQVPSCNEKKTVYFDPNCNNVKNKYTAHTLWNSNMAQSLQASYYIISSLYCMKWTQCKSPFKIFHISFLLLLCTEL